MRSSIFVFACALALSLGLHGQQFRPDANDQFNISGRVIDATTGQPLAFSNIYFSQSLKGTTSNVEGDFVMSNVKSGEYDLIVSFIGYKTHKRKIIINDANTNQITIKMHPETQSLDLVQVLTQRDKKWEKMLKRFESIILGKTRFSKQCSIKNPWVVSFTGDKRNFIATASELIEIENNALGFNVMLDLNRFQKLKDLFEFTGHFHFSRVEPKSASDVTKWEENRKIAYNGSLPHFFNSAINGTWIEEGYTVKYIDGTFAENNNKPFDIKPKGSDWLFSFSKPLKIIYNLEFFESEPQTSIITSRGARPLVIKPHGITRDPTSFTIAGYLTSEGVSTLLPLEYLRFEKESLEGGADLTPDAATSFVESFKKYAEWSPEKIFIRTDKEKYYAGETIWLRSYLLSAITNLPINKKSMLHLQLLNGFGEIVFHHRLNSINGGASGNLDLPDTLSQGTYLIRAFTDRMMTSDSLAMFQRVVSISEFSEDTESEDPKEHPELDLQFYPESGDLVTNVATTVAFTSNRMSFSGTLFEDDKALRKITPMHSGMGSFQLKPESGKRYFIRVEEEGQEFELPRLQEHGATISVNTDADKLDITVKITEAYKKTDLYLLAHSKGEIVFFKKVNSTRSESKIGLDWSDLSSGLNHLTLFDFNKRPLAERLIFKQNGKDASLEVGLNKADYSTQEEVELTLLSLLQDSDTLYTDLSVSVIDLDQASQSPGIKSYVEVISDLRIDLPITENPPLFEEKFESFSDLYMLIHSWRRFAWKDFMEKEYDTTRFAQLGISIKGQVLDEKRKPYEKIALNLIDSNSGSVYTTEADPLGSFEFQNLNIEDTDRLVLSITNSERKFINPVLEIDSTSSSSNYQGDPDWPGLQGINQIVSRDFQANELAYERKLLENLQEARLLDEVEIVSQKIEVEKLDPRKGGLGKGTYSISTKDVAGYENKVHIFGIIEGRVPGMRIVRAHRGLNPLIQHIVIRGFKTINAGQWAMVLVDNVPIPDEQISIISASDIESVEVYTGAEAAAYGTRGAQGVVAFFTKKGESLDEMYSDQFVRSFTYKNAFYTPIEFQHTDYNSISPDIDDKDLRSTLYWNPDISLTNFSSKEILFFTSDRATELLIDVQGITQTGELIHERKIITVN